MSKVSGGQDETSRVRGQGGGQEELPRVQGQGQQGGDTSLPKPGAVTLRSHPEPEARGSSWEEPPMPQRPGGATRGAVAAQAQEGLEELSHVEGQERW